MMGAKVDAAVGDESPERPRRGDSRFISERPAPTAEELTTVGAEDEGRRRRKLHDVLPLEDGNKNATWQGHGRLQKRGRGPPFHQFDDFNSQKPSAPENPGHVPRGGAFYEHDERSRGGGRLLPSAYASRRADVRPHRWSGGDSREDGGRASGRWQHDRHIDLSMHNAEVHPPRDADDRWQPDNDPALVPGYKRSKEDGRSSEVEEGLAEGQNSKEKAPVEDDGKDAGKGLAPAAHLEAEKGEERQLEQARGNPWRGSWRDDRQMDRPRSGFSRDRLSSDRRWTGSRDQQRYRGPDREWEEEGLRKQGRMDDWRAGHQPREPAWGGPQSAGDKWKHDLFDTVKESPPREPEEDPIKKIEALLAS